ncbi:caspase family protein [Microbacterium cremeum]|uniref:caspase family protein n=1 Tax=Microbacterium cremeum TaxID=2782169 RepID=UPI0018882845|nr:caspase family protein [Microbacterium cremeum]
MPSTTRTRAEAPETSPDAAGTGASRGGLTPAQLAALRPHVVATEDGELAKTSTARPKTVAEFATTAADIRRIFSKDLPAFLAAHPEAPVPIVIYAHGGLVDKAAGLATAHAQVDWWKENGAFPIHMVWESGLFTALADVIMRRRPGKRGFADYTDGVIEAAARLLGGTQVWGDMKLDAAAGSMDGGGASVLADELAKFVAAHRDDVTVHAVGHSAGSIFHAHFVPRALAAGVPRFDSVSLLAPAVRVDTFEQTLLQAAEDDRIGELSVFTMTDAKERDDNCFTLYRKSLLYLVSRAFEPERDAAILGMEKYLRGSRRSVEYLSAHADRLVLSPVAGPARRSSSATSHGGFDNDPPTMTAVALRVTGGDTVTPFPARPREVEMPPLPVDTGGGSRGTAPAKRALCIGVNAYEELGDVLHGCVADATAWSQALGAAGFSTDVMLDAEATRTGILSAMLDIVAEAKAGDVVAIQYAGHGTYVPDLDGDEDDAAGPTDEALCPVDFRQGRLIIDDDLAQIWDLIPEGVAVTLLFDSCHSGTANRGGRPDPAPPAPTARARLVRPDKELERDYARSRGVPTGDERRERARDVVIAAEPARSRNTTHNRPTAVRREVLISACLPNEVAMERDGQGVFTAAALQVLARGESLTNRGFVDAVIAQLGVRTQTPQLTADDVLAARPLLASAIDAVTIAAPAAAVAGARDRDGEGKRTAAIVAILRATADLLEDDGVG